MANFFKKTGAQLFAFLSSLQLAVVLLLSLAIILSVGTFYESIYDAEAAKYYVYNTWWFYGVLALLGINVLFAALSRYPWKRHHTGFLVVHLGILLILAGSMLSLLQGFEGQLIIPEGESRERIFLPESRLYFYDVTQNRLEELPADFRFDPPRPEDPFAARLFGDVLLKIEDYLENAQSRFQVVEGDKTDSPALKVKVQGSRATVEDWIFGRDYLRNQLNLGPAKITYLDVDGPRALQAVLADPALRGPVLRVGSRWFSLKENMGREISLPGKSLILENFFSDAAVLPGGLSNQSSEPNNPALQLRVREGKKEFKHTIFAKFPQLPSRHGEAQGSPLDLRLFWVPEGLGSEQHEMVLAMKGEEGGYLATKREGTWGPLKEFKVGGGEVRTGWMDFALTVQDFLPQARLLKEYRRLAVPPGGKGPPPALHLALAQGHEMRDFWIGRGESREIRLGPRVLKVAYALRSEALGFTVKLNDFKMGTYQGTDDPSSYESEITLEDPVNRVRQEHRIAMNQPLSYGKYKIFQASYQLDPNGPDWSVFSVAYDPGIFTKYLGSLVLVIGIVLIFFFRPAFLKRGSRKTAMALEKNKKEKLGAALAGLLFLLLLFPQGVWARDSLPQPRPGMDTAALAQIAILHEGRQKPLDSFARESARLLTGSEEFAGFEPVELLLSWITLSDQWENLPILQADHGPLDRQLQLPLEDGKIAPKALRDHAEFALYLQTVAARQQDGAKLSEAERQAALLNERLKLFYGIAEGSALTLIPASQGTWESLADLARRYPGDSFLEATPTTEAKIAGGIQGLFLAYHQGNDVLFREVAPLLKNLLRQRGSEVGDYPSSKAMEREVYFNRLKPFQWAWVGYALAFFIILLSYGVRRRWCYWTGMAVFLVAWGFHAYGFLLRILLSGRAPVTNMYETVLWVPFGMVLFAIILELLYRKRVYALAASALATLGLILAQSAPHILDPALDPLVPVLRNNFWLTVHVLTITLSYGAFTLALGVANINAGFYIFQTKRRDIQQSLNFFIYRAIQIGVVLLAAGTILGGVWANASWGRFWGWDPKEVWALIALLGYLALLHGRYAGWVKGFGLTVGAITAYLLVVMAWYGVNFILGVGLHSYGFSSGGAKFVSLFTAVELLWVFLAFLRFKLLLKDPSLKQSPV